MRARRVPPGPGGTSWGPLPPSEVALEDGCAAWSLFHSLSRADPESVLPGLEASAEAIARGADGVVGGSDLAADAGPSGMRLSPSLVSIEIFLLSLSPWSRSFRRRSDSRALSRPSFSDERRPRSSWSLSLREARFEERSGSSSVGRLRFPRDSSASRCRGTTSGRAGRPRSSTGGTTVAAGAFRAASRSFLLSRSFSSVRCLSLCLLLSRSRSRSRSRCSRSRSR